MSPRTEAAALPARRYHHGDLKRALTEAALELVGEKGPKGFTLTEAARRAGVSAAAPYRHFADKEALLAAVAEQGFRDLVTAIEAAATTAPDPVAGLLAMAGAYVGWATAHPDQYRVMFSSGTDKSKYPELKAAGDDAFGGLLTALRACQRAGILVAGDPMTLAGPLWALVHGVASLAVDDDFRQVGIDEPASELAVRAATAWVSALRRDR